MKMNIMFPRRIYCIYSLIKTAFIRNSWQLPIRKLIPAISLISYFSTKKDVKSTLFKITNKADELYEDEQYLEAYHLLIDHKDDNVEMQWRIGRVLYKMSRSDIYDKSTKNLMIHEAYDLICETENINSENGDVQKWMAILLDAKLCLDNKFSNIEDNMKVKGHLMEANRLKPNDYTILYMLGQWHYKLCTLNWLQRKFSKMFYPNTPKCNYEEALNYFLKAEELKPRFYLSNIYMLGKLNYHLGNMYRAHYYLAIATQMAPNTDQEEEYVKTAQKLIRKLKHYDVSDDAL